MKRVWTVALASYGFIAHLILANSLYADIVGSDLQSDPQIEFAFNVFYVSGIVMFVGMMVWNTYKVLTDPVEPKKVHQTGEQP